MQIILQEEIRTKLVHLEKEIDVNYHIDKQELCDLLKIDYYKLISIKHYENYVDHDTKKNIYVYKIKYLY